MNRYEFIGELRGRLKRLPKEELEDAARYYEEYFDEAGIECEQISIEEVGMPALVASEILAQAAIRQIEENPKSAKKGISAIILIIIAILGAPIALPLSIALILAVCSVVIAIGAVILALCISIVAIGISGILALIIGFIQLTVDPATGMVLLGSALLLIAIGLLFIIPIYYLTCKGIPSIIRVIKNILIRSKRGERI